MEMSWCFVRIYNCLFLLFFTNKATIHFAVSHPSETRRVLRVIVTQGQVSVED